MLLAGLDFMREDPLVLVAILLVSGVVFLASCVGGMVLLYWGARRIVRGLRRV